MRPVLCSCGRETPSAPSGLVPLRGAVVTTVLFALRMENKTAIMAAHGKQKGRYDPVESMKSLLNFHYPQKQNVMKCL